MRRGKIRRVKRRQWSRDGRDFKRVEVDWHCEQEQSGLRVSAGGQSFGKQKLGGNHVPLFDVRRMK